MACYRPNYVVYNNGVVGRFGGRLTQAVLDNVIPGQEIVPVPCGKCCGCRLDRSKAWADRMLLEFDTERENQPRRTALFLTLTYDDDHVPWIESTEGVPLKNLNRKDVQDFVKRLRFHFPSLSCRNFYAGEYGDQTWRPHYHMILFGFSPSVFPDTFQYSFDSKLNTELLESPTLNSIWSNGAVRFSVAEYSTFAYVARYVLKKQYTGDNIQDIYKGRVPPFVGMSRRPGIGGDYKLDAVTSRFFVPDKNGDVHEINTPRCLLEKKYLTNPEEYDNIKVLKRYAAAKSTALVASRYDMSWLDQLKDAETAYLNRRKLLYKRDKL